MFELAARLVGVYKVNHMTKSVTIENRDYVVRQQQQGQQSHGQGQGGQGQSGQSGQSGHAQGQGGLSGQGQLGQGGQSIGQTPAQVRGLQQQVRDSVLPLRPVGGR